MLEEGGGAGEEVVATVELAGAGGGGDGVPNTTDEEKAYIARSKGPPAGGSALGTCVEEEVEGRFVEGQLDRSVTPFVAKVLVTADVNPQT